MMKRIRLVFLMLSVIWAGTYTLSAQEVSAKRGAAWTFQGHFQSFLAGTGDHTGWKIGLGADAPIGGRFSVGFDAAIWVSQDYGAVFLFTDERFKYATIDAWPENYPFPEIIVSHEELTDYGVKTYVPQDNFWQSLSADLEVNYLLIDRPKWVGTVGLGASVIKTDYTYINEEWTAEIDPPGTEELRRFIMAIPLYVRYLDIGPKLHLNFARRFHRFNVGVDVDYYRYTSSSNITGGLVFQVRLN